ncbi:hypothetical protein AVEN_164908-1 [Araneus ventricosus]|uniref:Uncharacterized protein n=1 Tax=Araneus ventricosus TaxID=182803 RepID=A0A4Y2MTR4_ARAVE|nr:hypothetical protein AVEN_164908-1 [Araneus ventricosus]
MYVPEYWSMLPPEPAPASGSRCSPWIARAAAPVRCRAPARYLDRTRVTQTCRIRSGTLPAMPGPPHLQCLDLHNARTCANETHHGIFVK